MHILDVYYIRGFLIGFIESYSEFIPPAPIDKKAELAFSALLENSKQLDDFAHQFDVSVAEIEDTLKDIWTTQKNDIIHSVMKARASLIANKESSETPSVQAPQDDWGRYKAKVRASSPLGAKIIDDVEKYSTEFGGVIERCLEMNPNTKETKRNTQKMTSKELKENKSWYISAVESCLILRGMTKKQAKTLVNTYRLKERLDIFPELQLHYDVETTADEIMAEIASGTVPTNVP